eukprot:gene28851-37859_t
MSSARVLKLSRYAKSRSIPEIDPVSTSQEPLDKWQLLQKIWTQEILVFTLFCSTLALWPPLVTEIKSFNFPLLQETQWWPLLLLTVFSVSDCVGRLLTGYKFCLTADNLYIAVLLRLILFPLIVCSVKQVVFTHDFFSVLFVLLLGFTNGYLGSLSILIINEGLDEKDRGLAGTFTGFFLNLGLVVGATLGLYIDSTMLGKP